MKPREIVVSTAVFVNGGGESTAAWMTASIYYMLQNPHVYRQAKEEVRQTFATAEDITSTTSHNLTYLGAVMEETLRIYAPAPGNFARRTVVPTEIDGQIVPPNVSVGVHQYSANHSKGNFSRPDSFVPERWLKSTREEFRDDTKAAMQAWSIGPRACIGKK